MRSQGLSLTAFRNACRKLGILRWPYAKAGRSRSSTRDSSADHPIQALEHVDAPEDVMLMEGSGSNMMSSDEDAVTGLTEGSAASAEDQVVPDSLAAGDEGVEGTIGERLERRFIEWYTSQSDEDEEG
eukprot:653158-Hanusia_phi.AAC.1